MAAPGGVVRVVLILLHITTWRDIAPPAGRGAGLGGLHAAQYASLLRPIECVYPYRVGLSPRIAEGGLRRDGKLPVFQDLQRA